MNDKTLTKLHNNMIQLPVNCESSKSEFQTELASLFISLFLMGADEVKANAADRRKWEDVDRKIALMNKESQDRLQEMEHELSVIKSKTERLQYIFQTVRELDLSRLEVVGQALSRAIEQLTSER